MGIVSSELTLNLGEFSPNQNVKFVISIKKRSWCIINVPKMSFIFVKTYSQMKKSAFLFLVMVSLVILSSCTSSRSTAGAGCNMNRNLVGYKWWIENHYNIKKEANWPLFYLGCGAGGIRTHVQTYSPKAFYMLILELIVGKRQEPNKPTISVAGWS